MRLSFYNITKDQSNIIKGGAMLCLILHNFVHLTNSIGENEMGFSAQRIHNLIAVMKDSQVMILNGSLSYFGFFFLQLFIFITGYGLTKQYSKNPDVPYLKYLLPRLIKIYALLIIGLVMYFFLFYKEFDLDWFISFAASTLLMYNNFSFDRLFLYVGPWWYFSLVVQFYLIFPFLFRIVYKYKYKGFFIALLVSYALIYVLDPILEKQNFPTYGNLLGHVPGFLLGIGVALLPKLVIDWKVLVPTIIVFVLSNFYKLFYPFSFLTAGILMLALFYPIIYYAPAWIKKGFIFLGNISMFLFLINGVLRKFTLHWVVFETPMQVLLMSLVHLVIVIVVSYLMSLMYNKFLNPPINKLIEKIKNSNLI